MQKSSTAVIQGDVEENNKKRIELVQQLTSSSLYLKNRIKGRFLGDVPIKQTQGFLLEQMSPKVNYLLKEFNMSLRNQQYMNDHLKRLSDQVAMELRKKQQQYPSLLKMDDFKNFEKIINDYQNNRFESYSCTEKITSNRQAQQLSEILMMPHNTEKLILQEISLNQYHEVILEKLFFEKKLYQQLLEFTTIPNYEKLFRVLEMFETNHKVEMRLLADQFRGITTRMNALQKCERIIRNTVEHLESDMLKQIGHLDLLNINRKFKEIYLPQLQEVELYQIGQYFPSGVLFVLMRCGKVEEAQRILSGLVMKDTRLAERFQPFFELQQQGKINQNDVEEYNNIKGDLLLQQCFWLLLDVSEAYEVLEERQFPADKDLYIWMTLKTTHSSNEFVEYERNYCESKKSFHHWTLVDLYESVPEYNVPLRINVILQRYDYILDQFYRQHSSCVVQVEYFVLDAVISALNIKGAQSERSKQQQQSIIDSLVKSASAKYPLIACLLLKIHNHDIDSIAKLLSEGKHLGKVLGDQKVQSNLEQMFGNLGELTNIMVAEYFKDNLHNALKEFQQQLDKVNTVYSLHDCHAQLIGKLDEMSQYLKLLVHKKEQVLIETSLYLYHEVQLVQIFTSIIVSQLCTTKMGMIYEKKISARQLETLHPVMKSVAKSIKLEELQCRFQLIEIFQMAQSLMNVEKPTLTDINQMLGSIKIGELTKCLIGEGQEELIKMVFWQILQLIDIKKCQEKVQVINQVKEMNEAILRTKDSKGLIICGQEVHLNSVVVNILSVYTKVLKMY